MHKTAAALIALASIAPARAVEVYRCVADGATRYQERPCGGIVLAIDAGSTGVGGLRDGEVAAYLDAVERDVRRIDGPRQVRQLDTVNGHLTILRRIAD